MKLRYQEIEVNMERVQSMTHKVVPEWEVPLIQAVHPNTHVVRDVCVDKKPPSVTGEYQRLVAAYGAEREEGGAVGGPYIETVYGKGPQGLAALKAAMQGAVLPASTPVTPVSYSPELRQDLLQALSEDSADDLIEAPEEILEDA